MKYQSKVVEAGSVLFPEFKNERVYMLPFFKKEGLPSHLARWQSTVDQMLQNIETDSPIYLMIDQSFVKAGTPQRRPGLHIDGYWIPESHSHGQGGGRHSQNSVVYAGTHSNNGGSRHRSNKDMFQSWQDAEFKDHEALILASNISAARGFTGIYEGPIQEMGNCQNVSTNALNEVKLEANKAYIGNVTFLHESLPVENDCYRTLVRLNVPGFDF